MQCLNNNDSETVKNRNSLTGGIAVDVVGGMVVEDVVGAVCGGGVEAGERSLESRPHSLRIHPSGVSTGVVCLPDCCRQ